MLPSCLAKKHFALQHWRLMKDIILIHLPGVVNPADMLTKALGWALYHRHAPHLMGKLSWFCFQLLFPPRQQECVLLNFVFDDLCWFCFKFFWAGPFFPAVMRDVSHHGRVSAGQLCDLRTRPTHVASRTAICG